MKLPRAATVAVLVGASALVLASCGIGTTGAADEISQTTVRLHGEARSTLADGTGAPQTLFQFEYGPTDAYGQFTGADAAGAIPAGGFLPVSMEVTGFAPATTYHYRLCVTDFADNGRHCGADQTFTTEAGDSVSGDGSTGTFLVPNPMPGHSPVPFPAGGSFRAGSDADGSEPNGTAVARPSFLLDRPEDAGRVTCLKVVGNRATVGFTAPRAPGSPLHYTAFVEDNGPSGDRWSARASSFGPITTCPTATDADFQSITVFGTTLGPVLVSGDFTVHDEVAS